MHKRYRNIFIALFVFSSFNGFAQDDPPPAVDTVVSPPSAFQKNNADEGRFLPLTQASPVEQKKVSEEEKEALKRDDDYWYANQAPEKKQVVRNNDNDSSNSGGWLSSVLWIIILVSFIAVVIWYLLSSNINIFRKAPKKIMEEEPEEITEDIFALNYEKEIAKAVAGANYRLAVRLRYLQLLKALADKNRINYRQDKTNSDYINQLVNTTYYRDFFKLTRNFEYTWYGQFPLTEEGYRFMEKEFEGFKNTIR